MKTGGRRQMRRFPNSATPSTSFSTEEQPRLPFSTVTEAPLTTLIITQRPTIPTILQDFRPCHLLLCLLGVIERDLPLYSLNLGAMLGLGAYRKPALTRITVVLLMRHPRHSAGLTALPLQAGRSQGLALWELVQAAPLTRLHVPLSIIVEDPALGPATYLEPTPLSIPFLRLRQAEPVHRDGRAPPYLPLCHSLPAFLLSSWMPRR